MVKWIFAIGLCFVLPFVGIPLLLYLLHREREAKRSAEFDRSLGIQKLSDYSSPEAFNSELNSQTDGFEETWRRGQLFTNSDGHPSLALHDGIYWTKKKYIKRCMELGRKPIPELLEDFDLELKNSNNELESQISIFFGYMQNEQKNIVAKLEQGVERRKILAEYVGDFARADKKLVSVSCENSVWILSTLESLLVLYPKRAALLRTKFVENPDQFRIKFASPTA
jgi:hypothetical protein